jgi:hypothetical protein
MRRTKRTRKDGKDEEGRGSATEGRGQDGGERRRTEGGEKIGRKDERDNGGG